MTKQRKRFANSIHLLKDRIACLCSLSNARQSYGVAVGKLRITSISLHSITAFAAHTVTVMITARGSNFNQAEN